MNFTTLLATNAEQLQGIVSKIEELVNLYWGPLMGILGAGLLIWGIVLGVRYAIANKNDDKMNAKESFKALFIGIVAIAVIGIAGPIVVNVMKNFVKPDNATSALNAILPLL